MNEINTFVPGKRYNGFDVKISCNGTFALAYEISFVCFEPMNAKSVFFCINGNGTKVQFRSGSKNSNRNFTTIGNEEFFHEGNGGMVITTKEKCLFGR